MASLSCVSGKISFLGRKSLVLGHKCVQRLVLVRVQGPCTGDMTQVLHPCPPQTPQSKYHSTLDIKRDRNGSFRQKAQLFSTSTMHPKIALLMMLSCVAFHGKILGINNGNFN